MNHILLTQVRKGNDKASKDPNNRYYNFATAEIDVLEEVPNADWYVAEEDVKNYA